MLLRMTGSSFSRDLATFGTTAIFLFFTPYPSHSVACTEEGKGRRRGEVG
jgi:hypothetical protein